MVETTKNRLFLDAYNANPSSTRAALENFAQLIAPKKGVILGDMLELGTVAGEEHQKIVDILSGMKLDLVYLVGPNYSGCRMKDAYQCFNNSQDLALFLSEKNPEGYLFLIKGSRGMKLETTLTEL